MVKSYTDGLRDLFFFLKLNLFIGVNGCSLRTKENCDVVKEIPLDRMILESCSPYCYIQTSYEANKYLKTFPKANPRVKNPEQLPPSNIP